MVDLTEHLRKAGKVKTPKKTLASRATSTKARETKLRIASLRRGLRAVLSAWDSTCSTNGWDPDHLVEVKKARATLSKEIGGRK